METGRTTILSVNVNFYVVFLGETVCSFRLFNNIFLTTLTSFFLFRAGINDQKNSLDTKKLENDNFTFKKYYLRL